MSRATSWPREIEPENRIKYLIQARHDFKDQAEWKPDRDALICSTEDELLSVTPQGDGFEAWYSDESDSILVGEFDKASEAKKALIDHVVVTWAMKQAWEDVAT